VLIGENTLECETANISEGSKDRVTVRPEDILCSAEDKMQRIHFRLKLNPSNFSVLSAD